MLPKQSTGLFRKIVMTRFYMLLVGENSYVSQTNFVCLPDPHPFSAFLTFDCAPARRVAALRAEVSPYGDKGSALDLQGGRGPLDSRLGIAVSGTFAAKL